MCFMKGILPPLLAVPKSETVPWEVLLVASHQHSCHRRPVPTGPMMEYGWSPCPYLRTGTSSQLGSSRSNLCSISSDKDISFSPSWYSSSLASIANTTKTPVNRKEWGPCLAEQAALWTKRTGAGGQGALKRCPSLRKGQGNPSTARAPKARQRMIWRTWARFASA